jgi:Fe2+ transport system protein FeoA
MNTTTQPPISLADLCSGQQARVDHIPPDAQAARRLAGLGVYEGVCLRVIHQADPMIILAGATRIGIAASLARQIRVTLAPAKESCCVR